MNIFFKHQNKYSLPGKGEQKLKPLWLHEHATIRERMMRWMRLARRRDAAFFIQLQPPRWSFWEEGVSVTSLPFKKQVNTPRAPVMRSPHLVRRPTKQVSPGFAEEFLETEGMSVSLWIDSPLCEPYNFLNIKNYPEV